MIRIEGLHKTYGSTRAVDEVSFTASPGRVTGYLGPDGAGTSPTIRILVGLTKATSGTAAISGRRFADLPNPGREDGVANLGVTTFAWVVLPLLVGLRLVMPGRGHVAARRHERRTS